MSRVAVVGAGLGGLACAARLAAGGHEVVVLERSDEVGGKLGTYARDGFVFDTGPSLVTMPHVLAQLFADTGDPIDEVLDLQRLALACRYRFADGTALDMPNERAAIAPALDAALGPPAGAQWSAFLRRAETIWDATHGPFLESPIGARDLLRLAARGRDLRAVAPWRSLRGLGAAYLRDPRLRTLLDRYATYTGSDPRCAPAALATVPFVEQHWGSWTVPGGLRRIAGAVAARAEERGAVVRTGAPVAAIRTAGGRVRGVRLAGGEDVDADVVVSNADAAATLARVEPARRTRSRVPFTRPARSSAGFVLLLALDGRDPATPHHRVLFTDDYDAEFDATLGRGAYRGRPRPVADPTVYVHAPDDPALRPDDDCEAWFVLVTAPPHDPGHGVDWDAPGLAGTYADRVLAVMAARGVDVRHRIRWRHVRTPADLERATATPGGSIYGSSSDGAAAAFLRPANRSPVPGLFLVGGSSHPGGGLPLVTLSARIVADLVGPSSPA